MKLSWRKNFSFSFISQDDRKEGMTAFIGKRKAEFMDNWYLFFSKSRSLRELSIVVWECSGRWKNNESLCKIVWTKTLSMNFYQKKNLTSEIDRKN